MSEKTVAATRTEMSEVMTPDKANFLGKIFGGSLLAMIDLAAYVTASRFTGMLCVTASIDRVDFHEPIEVAEVVTCIGHVTNVGRTSLEVTIEVFAEDLFKQTNRHTNTARVTMVALKDGRPSEVPRLKVETREDKERVLAARIRRELRAEQRAELERLNSKVASSSDKQLDELLASSDLLGAVRKAE